METKSFRTGSSALRRGRASLAHQPYLITTSTAGRRPWFASAPRASVAREVLDSAASWPAARPWVWILMPDHLHVLCDLTGTEPLSRVVARIKGLISRRLKLPEDRPLWQASFHDHALRAEEDVIGVARYVLANPVRAGLVSRQQDWPWRGGLYLDAVETELIWKP